MHEQEPSYWPLSQCWTGTGTGKRTSRQTRPFCWEEMVQNGSHDDFTSFWLLLEGRNTSDHDFALLQAEIVIADLGPRIEFELAI